MICFQIKVSKLEFRHKNLWFPAFLSIVYSVFSHWNIECRWNCWIAVAVNGEHVAFAMFQVKINKNRFANACKFHRIIFCVFSLSSRITINQDCTAFFIHLFLFDFRCISKIYKQMVSFQSFFFLLVKSIIIFTKCKFKRFLGEVELESVSGWNETKAK